MTTYHSVSVTIWNFDSEAVRGTRAATTAPLALQPPSKLPTRRLSPGETRSLILISGGSLESPRGAAREMGNDPLALEEERASDVRGLPWSKSSWSHPSYSARVDYTARGVRNLECSCTVEG